MMTANDLLPHLFRTEFRKIASVLCRHLGIQHMALAEDIASDTFLLAFETWPYKGTPENPVAWLHRVARNKALNELKRNKIFTEKIASAYLHDSEFEIDFSEKNISDSQLHMLFALCQPRIAHESQIALALRILCGFGIDEIANAFLTNKETINKRLHRAREKLREHPFQLIDLTEAQINERLDTVATMLYLLFNEGYYSESNNQVLRKDFCLEAMRLTYQLIDFKFTDQPSVNALFALMCFHASRFDARFDSMGEIVLYDDQDESNWNHDLIAKGNFYLQRASESRSISRYHIEAWIGYWHTIKSDSGEKWENILQLYNKLLQIQYSPVAALNRTFALSKVRGKHIAIAEAEKLGLNANPFYFSLLGELYSGIDNARANEYLQRAVSVAKTQADKNVIRKKIEKLLR